MTEQLVAERDRLLTQMCENLPVAQVFPLVKEVALDAPQFSALRHAVGTYLRASLRHGGYTAETVDDQDLVARCAPQLLSLPNVTPNGILRPKLETNLEFNIVHCRLAECMQSLGIDDHLAKMRLPIAVRIVGGTAPAWVENRPRATNLMHSDFWTGACCDLACVVPILGDVERTGLRFRRA